MDIVKLHEIFNWMNNKELYKNGVTNDDVINKFGATYKDAWTKLKSRKKSLFYENGRWFRWQ
jgi:hypothetical protein